MKLRSFHAALLFSSPVWKGTVAFSCLLLGALIGCKNKGNTLSSESEVSAAAGGSRNGGFRIAPQLAARDPLRFKVIYRCNDVPCGEAFQPSNEERDLFIPCGLEANVYPSGRFPAFLRVVGPTGKQKLIVKSEHRQACENAQPFEKVVADTQPKDAPQAPLAGNTCQSFRSNREICQANEAQGCRWVTHPSGRAGLPGGGDCVGLFRSVGQPTGAENVQSLQSGSQPVSWAPVESYRPAATGRNSDLK